MSVPPLSAAAALVVHDACVSQVCTHLCLCTAVYVLVYTCPEHAFENCQYITAYAYSFQPSPNGSVCSDM